jgi:hypothetical protein
MKCLRSYSIRVEVHTDHLIIQFAEAGNNDHQTRPESLLSVSWQKAASRRRREILIPEGTPPQQARHIRSENRATLVASITRARSWLTELITAANPESIASITRARSWLTELITDPTANPESIAKREQCSVRKVNLIISLAFLAPDLVKAAIDGALPHGMGVVRLANLPAEWSRQRRILGLGSRTDATSNRVSGEPVSVSWGGFRRPRRRGWSAAARHRLPAGPG